MSSFKHESAIIPAQIRKERPSDIDTISEITVAAFETHPISRHTEQHIINALRAAGALSLSLVAEINGEIVGHIAFSPITITDGSPNWYGLGPISVLPKFQRQGIGINLVKKGLAQLKEAGGQGCALVGGPEYYKRFGFRNYPDLELPGVPQEVFLALPFSQHHPKGGVAFHEGFLAES